MSFTTGKGVSILDKNGNLHASQSTYILRSSYITHLLYRYVPFGTIISSLGSMTRWTRACMTDWRLNIKLWIMNLSRSGRPRQVVNKILTIKCPNGLLYTKIMPGKTHNSNIHNNNIDIKNTSILCSPIIISVLSNHTFFDYFLEEAQKISHVWLALQLSLTRL